MAYATAGLRMWSSGVVNTWILDTVDAVTAAVASDYISDAGPTDTLPGRGMQVGDAVFIRVVGALPASQEAPATCTDTAWAHVSAIDTTTGAGSLTLSHAN
ncbi:MAG: hypothetical protein AAGD43_18065 [Pseudomonadota bacterium]